MHLMSTRLWIGLAVGLGIALVDNFAFSGEVSPIIIVTSLLAVTLAAGAKWGWQGWLATAGMWIGLPSAHMIKRIFDLPDTLHPNTYASILKLAIFSFVVATIGLICGALSRKLLQSSKSGTDLEMRATFDREDGATRGARVRSKTIGACGHAARHAVKCAE